MSKPLQEYPIIGLAGPATAGKSTIAEMLGYSINITSKARVFSFAQPIKDMLIAGLGVYSKSDSSNNIAGWSCRDLMQSLGTEWGRNTIHADIWVERLHQSRFYLMDTHEGRDLITIVDDVRFENEADYIRREGGVVIHVRGRGGIDSDHSSEDGINKILGDIELDNSGTIDKLKSKLDALCGDGGVQSV